MADAITKGKKRLTLYLIFGIRTEKKGGGLQKRQKEDTVIILDDFFIFHTLMQFLLTAQ